MLQDYKGHECRKREVSIDVTRQGFGTGMTFVAQLSSQMNSADHQMTRRPKSSIDKHLSLAIVTDKKTSILIPQSEV